MLLAVLIALGLFAPAGGVSPEPEKSKAMLKLGKTYKLQASGVISDWTNVDGVVDAVWCYADWRCGAGIVWDQLRVNGRGMTDIAVCKLPYNPGHVYEVELQGEGKPLTLWMYDAQSSSGDNSGEITVRIFE